MGRRDGRFDPRRGTASPSTSANAKAAPEPRCASTVRATVAQACAIATTPGRCRRRARRSRVDGPRSARVRRWHPWQLDADLAIVCPDCENAVPTRPPHHNSDGASVGSSASLSVYANSHGFVGRERSTQHSIGCALIAGQGDAMQRDGWYSTALSEADLEAPAAIGRLAAQRAVARLAPRQLPRRSAGVVHSEVARSLIGHLPAPSPAAPVSSRQFPARQRRHAVVSAMVLVDRASVPVARAAFGGVRRRGRGDARIGAGCGRRPAALCARQLFGAQARPGHHRQCRWRAQSRSQRQSAGDLPRWLAAWGRAAGHE